MCGKEGRKEAAQWKIKQTVKKKENHQNLEQWESVALDYIRCEISVHRKEKTV